MSNETEVREVKVTLGRIEADVPYVDQKQKELIEMVIGELNIEYNNINLQFHGIDETVLLFFLLFKTQSDLIQKTSSIYEIDNMSDYLMKVFANVSGFIKNDEKDKTKINKFLVAVIVYKKIDLKNSTNSTDTKGKNFGDILGDFTTNIKKQLELLGDKISLL